MPEHRDRARLRETFEEVAQQYDRARPTYPAAAEVQADYDAVVPHPENRPPPPPEEAPDLRAELEEGGLFHDVAVARHRWDVRYTADEWVAVLGTYSENIARRPNSAASPSTASTAASPPAPAAARPRHYVAVLTVGRRL
jgi:hypothetical protein